MKRLFLSLSILLAFTLTATAQPHRNPRPRRDARRYHVPAPRPHPRTLTTAPFDDHFGDIRLHAGGELGLYDFGGIFMHDMPYHYSIGGMAEFQTGRHLSLGLGVEYYGIRHINYNQFTDGSYLNCVPIYGNLRLSTNGWVRLFAEARAGYAIPTNQVYVYGQDSNMAARGFYTGAAVGIDIYNNNLSIGFNSVDIGRADAYQPVYHNGNNRKVIATDFYLRYSYAFPLN